MTGPLPFPPVLQNGFYPPSFPLTLPMSPIIPPPITPPPNAPPSCAGLEKAGYTGTRSTGKSLSSEIVARVSSSPTRVYFPGTTRTVQVRIFSETFSAFSIFGNSLEQAFSACGFLEVSGTIFPERVRRTTLAKRPPFFRVNRTVPASPSVRDETWEKHPDGDSEIDFGLEKVGALIESLS